MLRFAEYYVAALSIAKSFAQQVYTRATEHVCHNSCIVTAAILKAMEVAAGIFLPGDCHVEFVEGAI